MILAGSVNPSEHGWPFAEGAGQVVTQHHWKTMAQTWQSNGVAGMPYTGTPSAGNTGLTGVRASETVVTVQPGHATINGFYYELTTPKDFSLDITGLDFADDGTGRLMRRDLVVLKVDEVLGEFRLVQIKNGVTNASGSWQVVLNDPTTEIPLFQVDVQQDIGVDRIVDRRWFLSQSIRPLRFEEPGFEPAPADGELGVDATGSRLVIGKAGQWISAREVFTNDIPPEITTRLDGHDTSLTGHGTRLDTLDGSVSALQTNVSEINTTMSNGQLMRDLTFTLENTANWNLNSPAGATLISNAYVFDRYLHVTIGMQRLLTDFAPMAWGATPIVLMKNIVLPAGAEFRNNYPYPAVVSLPTVTTAGTNTTAWITATQTDGMPSFVLKACPSGIKVNGFLHATFSMPLIGDWA
ncbi:hypothetical protein ACTMTF_15160 [Nonomuraea sp. ZG12]|uniref:hypothetical protein n=1 Tax=Nonomuraea sp. ZG12 TaxID=3452207 RepID=UPI003F8B9E07